MVTLLVSTSTSVLSPARALPVRSVHVALFFMCASASGAIRLAATVIARLVLGPNWLILAVRSPDHSMPLATVDNLHPCLIRSRLSCATDVRHGVVATTQHEGVVARHVSVPSTDHHEHRRHLLTVHVARCDPGSLLRDDAERLGVDVSRRPIGEATLAVGRPVRPHERDGCGVGLDELLGVLAVDAKFPRVTNRSRVRDDDLSHGYLTGIG